MNSFIYKDASLAFVDQIDPKQYIRLDSNIVQLQKIVNLLQSPVKMIIITGEPGVGKTALLYRLLEEIDKSNLFTFFQPPFSLPEFKNKITYTIFQKDGDIFKLLETIQEPINIIIDEVQLFSDEVFEYIRLLSDTNKIRFVLSMHTDTDNKLLKKQHFNTRIAQYITLFPPSKQDLLIYIQKKLILSNLPQLAQAFNSKNIHMIYQFTLGNLRNTNKFLYTFFDILHYYEQTKPSFLGNNPINKKFIEMTAIYLGYIDA